MGGDGDAHWISMRDPDTDWINASIYRVQVHGPNKATVQFDRDAAPLKDAAKPIMLGVLEYVGMHIDDIPQWTFAVSGKQITMEGNLSDASLRRLLRRRPGVAMPTRKIIALGSPFST